MTASLFPAERASPALRRALPLLSLALIAGGTVVALALFAKRHLPNIGIWFDESMQFWMSIGNDPYGAPFGAPGRLVDSIHFNGLDNLDPGGFTVLLHWWLHVGTGVVWQRALPFAFFLLGSAALALIGWRKSRSLLFAFVCGLVPALYPMLLDYATELRAYSMEFAGVVIGCALVDRITLKPARDLLLLAAGATFGFFLTSRYAFSLFTAASAFALIASCHLRRRAGAPTTRLADLPAMAVPVMAVAALIAAFALWPQFRARIHYQNGAMLQYFASTTAASKSFPEIASALAYNLLSPVGLPITIAALAGGFLLLNSRASARGTALRGTRLQRLAALVERAELGPSCLICLAALVISALTWRWHPWDLSAKWSLWLQGLSTVVLVQISAAALARVPAARTGPAAAAMLLIAALLDIRLATYQRVGWPSLVSELAKLESLAPSPETVAIDAYDYPTLRYLYEFGPLTGSRIYPGAFRFSYYDAEKPLISADTRFLVSGRTFAAALENYAPNRIVADPDFPPHLFRVEPATPAK